MTDFEDLLCLERLDALRFGLEIPEDWMQGRTAFGGLVAAAAVRAIREVLGDRDPLRALHTAYVAPVAAGTATLAVEVVRQGKHVTQAAVRVTQAGAIVTCVHAALGARRPSGLSIPRRGPPAAFSEEDGLEFPYLPGITPVFTQHFAYRLAEGSLPFSGSSDARLRGHCRHRTGASGTGASGAGASGAGASGAGASGAGASGAGASGAEAVIALLDAWPSPAMNLGTRPFPASTVAWTAHLVAEPGTYPDPGWWRYEAEALTCQDGYSTTLARLFAGDELVAWMEELVAVFDG